MNTMLKKLVGCFGLFMSLALASQAGQYWWSGNGTTLGGNGTWNATSATNWGTSVAGPFNMSWPNGGGDEAVFTNTSGTVTLGTTINLNAMTFTANNAMTFNSGTLDFGNGAATLSISNDANVTLNSSLAGSGTLSLKTTKNTWQRGFTLKNANNSAFTGKLVAQSMAGTYFWLFATNDFNFGAVPASFIPDAVSLGGGVCVENAAGNTLNISTNRGITVQASGCTFISSTGTINLNSIISGPGNSGALQLNANGGTIKLNAVNTYMNRTDLYGGGSYVIGVDNALPHGAGRGSVQFRCWNSRGLLDLNGHTLTINGLYQQGATYDAISGINNAAVGAATLIVGDADANNYTFSCIITNSGAALSLIKIGTGTQTLSGFCTYTGATTVNGGTLTISGTNSASSGMTVNNGGTLVISGLLSNAVPLTVNAGGTLRADLLVNTNGVFNSASAVTLAGGTLNVKGKNSGTSMTALGNLNVNPSGSTISITPNGGSGTTLTLGNTWTRQVGGTLLIDISAAGSSILSSSPTLTNGIIGGYAFVKDAIGTGFATVTGGNVARFTGTTLLDATVALSDLNGSLNYIAAAGVTLSGPSATQNVNSIEASAGFSSGSKTLLVGSGGVLLQGTGWFGFSGTLTSPTGELIVYSSNNGSPDLYAKVVDYGATKVDLIKTGSGAIRLGVSGHAYTGNTIVNGGWLGRASEIPYGAGKGNLVVDLGGTVDLEGGNLKVNGLTQSAGNMGGSVTTANYGGTLPKLTVGYADTSAAFSGVISDQGAARSLALIKVGAGTQTLSGANTYYGGTILSNGVLSVSSTNNIGGANAKVTFAGGTLRITGTSFTSFGATPVTVSGNVGLDIVESTNAFTFTNDVTGTLTKTGSGSLAVSGSVASLVTDNRTLVSESGSVDNWTLKSLTGGAYTPAGIESVTGTLTLEGNYTFDLNADGTGDKLTATGAVTMNSIVVTIAVPSNLTDKSKVYTLVQGSSLSGSFSLASVLPQDWKLKKEGNALLVRYVSPGTMVSFF